MSSLKYRCFCCGVVATSISWALIIFIYSSHLEGLSKKSLTEERQRIREELAIGGSGRKKADKHGQRRNYPFAGDHPFDSNNHADDPVVVPPIRIDKYGRVYDAADRKPHKHQLVEESENALEPIPVKQDAFDNQSVTDIT